MREEDTDQPRYAMTEQFDFTELHEHLLHVAALLLR
eukprot:CAMPEP_0185591084 /NCGR_PEP_ID=MMETSP0434-20130131/63343_1 /TAXON_ID=626734 ORGANISM="Favella taraikaensis, Strain Fe Narragansett Bay" /NCGR_SAMPLE_ID=MMETSP0434 /ASSEMBLY_ACC=CAM_ASM_000379 /LENGTH=35 /DNA_ID= /DNA_START= /DNA_END= /DNA_ORIENTATION=